MFCDSAAVKTRGKSFLIYDDLNSIFFSQGKEMRSFRSFESYALFLSQKLKLKVHKVFYLNPPSQKKKALACYVCLYFLFVIPFPNAGCQETGYKWVKQSPSSTNDTYSGLSRYLFNYSTSPQRDLFPLLCLR